MYYSNPFDENGTLPEQSAISLSTLLTVPLIILIIVPGTNIYFDYLYYSFIEKTCQHNKAWHKYTMRMFPLRYTFKKVLQKRRSG